MIEDKLSKLNESIPEFNSKDDIKNKIFKKHNSKKITSKPKILFRFDYISIPLVLLIICLVSGIMLVPYAFFNNNQTSSPHKTEYEIHQEKLSKKYSSSRKNYLSSYLESMSSLEEAGSESEYINSLIKENEKQEEDVVLEDVYYEITIDYGNGKEPEIIVAKKGELIFPEVFQRSGYYFLGWFVDEVELTQALKVTKDTRIYAKWSIKESTWIGSNYYEYYKDIDGVVIVSSKVVDSKVLEIPSKINDLDVIGLGYNSFNGLYSNNHNITEKIIIPDSVREIKAQAISNYYLLEEIYLPSSLEVIYANALVGCPLLNNIYIGNNANYEVINNMLVDTRTNSLVKGTVTSKDIPVGIVTIEARAFSDYKLIEEINIPETVEVIKSNAFSNCTSLKSVILPSKLKKLEEGIFSNCTNLKTVYIGKNVTSIHDLTFRGCNNLKSIVVDENNETLYSTESCLINKATQTLLVGFNVEDGIVIIPNDIKVIAHSAFYGRNSVTKVIFSESVERVEYSAFSECPNLEYVKLNDNLKELEGLTFTNCIKLKEVVMPSSTDFIGQYVFWRCERLEEISIPKNIKTIPHGMFSDCKSLVSVNLNDIITEIEASAFYGCKSLISFDLSNTIKIGNDAFGFCTSLEKIDLDSATNISDRAFYFCTSLKDVYIPKTVTYIGTRAFDSLKNAVIYCEDKTAKLSWASDFNGETKVIYGSKETVSYLDFLFTVINNNELELTKYFGNEESIVIPSEVYGMSVTTIGEKVFYLKNVTSIKIPNTVTLIKKYAFYHCQNLKSIEIPGSVKEISDYAFWYCENLESIKLNEGLEILGASSFGHCNLTSVTVPSTLKQAKGSVFEYNINFVELVNLSKVRGGFSSNIINTFYSLDYESGIFTIDEDFLFCFDYRNEVINLVTYLGNDTFINLPSDVSFTVNEKTYTTYVIRDSAFEYNDRLVKVVIPEGVTAIGERAFFACFNLTSITIPSTVTSIGRSVVANDEHLFEVYNLSSLTSNEIYASGIAYYAKEVHTSLSIPSKVIKADNGLIYYVGGENNNYIVGYDHVEENLVLPSNINNQTYIIASYVFENNQTIKTVVLPEGITEIHRNAFGDCENIKELVIPSSVIKITWYAFYSMDSLEKVTFVDKTPWIVKTSSNPATYKEIDVTDPYKAATSLRRNYMYDWNKQS